ncbi:hypothetical protein OIU84_026415 [Salix udensis]|uniref:1-acylglycerol-3-phosphate O-acyltransferase n=1 Tax=Salix udensis TaxID=889485 RepID=A0AAD6KLU9_9ROSI|nr:hypothetical protein OIU84_026415 [Salix udensis]
MGKEHALVMCNHRSDIDWLVGWVLAQRSGCLGSAVAVMKKSSKFLPVIGWSMWFSEYLFLERNWAKDEITLKSGLQRLRDFPRPFWLALFVEGTRFTQAKLFSSSGICNFSRAAYPQKCFDSSYEGICFSSSPPPTMLNLFKGKSSVVHIHIKRHLMKELPETDDGIAQWCKDVFVAKDALLDKHMVEDTFSAQELQDLGRPKTSLVVVTSWACLLISGALKFLQWSSLLSSRRGIAFTMSILAVITVLMHILIRFSQSERSTPAKVAPAKTKNGGKPSETGDDKQH